MPTTENLQHRVVVEDLEAGIEFFLELGLELEKQTAIRRIGRKNHGAGNQRIDAAMMRTADGNARVELARLLDPIVIEDIGRLPRIPWGISAQCLRWPTSKTRSSVSKGEGDGLSVKSAIQGCLSALLHAGGEGSGWAK